MKTLLFCITACATTSHVTKSTMHEKCPDGYTTYRNAVQVTSCEPPMGSGNICHMDSNNELGLLEWKSVPDAQGNEYNSAIVCPFHVQSELHTLPVDFLSEYNIPAQGPETAKPFICKDYPPSNLTLLNCEGTVGGYRVNYSIISHHEPRNHKKVSDLLTIEVGGGKTILYIDRWNGEATRAPEQKERRASASYILDVVDDHELIYYYRFKHDRPGTPRDTAIFVSLRNLILTKAPAWASEVH